LPNKPTHRMSGDSIYLKTRHQRPPLIGGLNRYMKDRFPIFPGVCSFLLLGLAMVSPAQEIDRPSGGVPQLATGIFESQAKLGEHPLFILHLETNGTYHVQCNEPDRVQGIDGGGLFSYQGTESGTWRWEPQTHRVVLKATKTGHMARWFPHVFEISQDRSERLGAINPPPEGPQNGWPLWMPLESPYFNRKGT
jgi:hypothetical protein